MSFRTEKLVSIATLENSVEIQLLGAIFDERGIRYVMDPLGSTPYAGVFETQKGQVQLKVFPEDEKTARELLEGLMEDFPDEDYEREERDSTE